MKNYFKKFSIMFVMLLALIGVGAIQNGTVANAATIGQQLPQAEDGWRRIEDSDDNFSYMHVGVVNYSTSITSGGTARQFDPTYLGTIKFNFTGTKLRLIFRAYNYGVNPKITIDGGAPVAIPCAQYDNFIVLVYDNVNLSDKEHYVTISSDKVSHVFDCIDIDEKGVIKPYNENPEIRPSNISINKSTDSLQVGQSDNLVETTTPSAVKVTWKSSDESIATVDQTGKVTAVKEGQATITATTTDGSNLSASCIVTVTPQPVVPTPQPTEEETIVNTARAKGDNTNNAGGSVSIIFKGVAEAQLSVVKTADVDSVYVGDAFTYTIVVTNTSSKIAKAVVVNDSAPNHIDFNVSGITTTQGQVDPSSTSKNIVVNVGDIPPSGTVTIKIPSTVIP